MKSRLLLSWVFLVALSNVVLAQVPQTMSYQGVLTDADGSPVANGTYTLTFKLYNIGDAVNWTEIQQVPVKNGLINIILGKVQPLSLAFDQPYRLGITIGNEPELEPRIELTSAAYSLNASSVSDSSVTGAKIARNHVVRSINNLRDEVRIVAGDNVTIKPEGQTLLISAAATGGGDGHSLDAADGSPVNAVFVDNEGNVGVGTDTPGEKLDVEGNIRASGIIRSGNSLIIDGGTAFVGAPNQITSTSGEMAIGGAGNFSFADIKVGIGTTSPDAALQVVGAFNETKGTLKITTPSSFTGFTTSLLLDSGHIDTTPSIAGSTPLFLNSLSTGDVRLVNGGGNVGIATQVPLSLLHISTQERGNMGDVELILEADIDNNNENDNPYITFRQDGDQVNAFIGLEGTGGARSTGTLSNAFVIGSEDNNPAVQFVTNDNVRMTIATNGFVGIGTASPNEKLEIANVNGARIIVSDGAGSDRRALLFQAPSGSQEYGRILAHKYGFFSGPQDLVLQDTGGNVGIGTTTPSATLDVAGNVKVNGVVVHASDIRLKKNIEPIDEALDKILKLRGVMFEWKNGPDNRNPEEGAQIGLIAQEVEAIIPEIVRTDPEGYKSVAYANVTAILIEAIKEQQGIIENQKIELSKIQAKVDELAVSKSELEDLKVKMIRLESALGKLVASQVLNRDSTENEKTIKEYRSL